MAHRPTDLSPNIIKITPRKGLFAQNLAVWSTGYDYALATFIWNIAASRAGANQAEVDAIVKARMGATGEDQDIAYNALVLESGMFQLSEGSSNDALQMDSSLIQAIRDAAAAESKSPADYLREKLNIDAP